MGGAIEAESEIGKGASFEVEIPLFLVESRRAKHMEKTTSERSHYRGHVLLVEDNAINQKVALNMLKRFGLEVSTARNGEEAIEQA